jgi:hypothetical protein
MNVRPLGLRRHRAKPLFIEISPMAGQVNGKTIFIDNHPYVLKRA